MNSKDTDILLDIGSENVCVLGLGFVGLTLSVVLADLGFKVYGLDINQQQVDIISSGDTPFHEDSMDSYLKRYVGSRFIPTTKLADVDADIYIISVGTPVDMDTKKPTTQFIEAATKSLVPVLKEGDLVILRSTVPIGLTRNIVMPILNESGLKPGEGYFIAFAPERTTEGHAIPELRELPQIVGGYDRKSALLAERLFRRVATTVIDVGSLESAEMVKILNNTFRDVKFGYANQMALICKDFGLDMVKLVQAANYGYPRDKIPVPSPGVGGACLTKDPYILIDSCKDIKNKPKIVEEARLLNEYVPVHLAQDLANNLQKINKDIKQAKIFIAGFAFKGHPETSDIRGSTTIDLLAELNNLGASKENIYGYDFVVDAADLNQYGVIGTDLETGFEAADAIIIMNNHKKFRKIDIMSYVANAANDCIFVDGWHLFEPTNITSINSVKYLSVGCEYESQRTG